MEKYHVIIEETVSQTFSVWANPEDDSLEIVREKYRSSKFALAPGEVLSKQMALVMPDSERIEWVEF